MCLPPSSAAAQALDVTNKKPFFFLVQLLMQTLRNPARVRRVTPRRTSSSLTRPDVQNKQVGCFFLSNSGRYAKVKLLMRQGHETFLPCTSSVRRDADTTSSVSCWIPSPVLCSYFRLITPNEFVYPYCPLEHRREVSCQRERVKLQKLFCWCLINLPGFD